MLKPALLLIAGRILGFTAAFLTPLVLVRLFDLHTFGTYKQWFLLYITLLAVTQIGMSESLLYFLPRAGGEAGRYVMNSLLTLAGVGAAVGLWLTLHAEAVGAWMNNPELTPLIPLLGVYLLLMQASIGLETVMTARSSYRSAALAYAATDLCRAAFLILPLLWIPSLQALLYGAIAFASLRLIAAWRYFRREFGSDLRPDAACLKAQLAYALPFGLAVVATIAQENLHQYAVSGRYDAATFALYSVGCMQVPLVDMIGTTVCNVMMVGMTGSLKEGRQAAVVDLWHQTIRKLALAFFPLTCLLWISARDVIVMLFTEQYLPSVPVFQVGVTAIVFAVLPMDALLRVYAHTRLLLVINLLRLGFIVGSISWAMASFGLVGAAAVTVIALAAGKMGGVLAASSLWQVGLAELLPWRWLARIGVTAMAAALPALVLTSQLPAMPSVRLLAAGLSYTVTYVGLAFRFGLLTSQERRTLLQQLSRLQFVLPPRYQHKLS